MTRWDQKCSARRILHALDSTGHEMMRTLVEAVHARPEAVEILGVAGGGERGQRAAVERTFESNHPGALGLALGEVVVPRHLQRALDRFSTRIAEEHLVGKALFAQPRRQLLAVHQAGPLDLGGLLEVLGGLHHERLHLGRLVWPALLVQVAYHVGRYIGRHGRGHRGP